MVLPKDMEYFEKIISKNVYLFNNSNSINTAIDKQNIKS